ncbi:DUF2264 domain-containing protein [Jiangella mangrovi]|uniref:DUF2264 domain-containing protein n=1 Tax=Jiangella mangrovi TaxID=1524084 RepID=A0A7W9GLA7_9ACTN|nr:DUF2264 domain-containing protein [Jiangella mangrovi]MBB5785631.1 hypothetical protein [Jiangella mangrovi]
MLDLPADDHARSPHTGWTRDHWEAVADHKLLALRPYASPRHALIALPGPSGASGRWSDRMEAFARSFLLAGFRVGGAGGKDPHGFLDWYAEGLAAGTDPSSPERWPRFGERGQAKVEAASIAIALHETRPWLWDRLPARIQETVVDWMAEILGTFAHTNNWVWFQNVVEAFLRSVGGPWRKDEIERNLAVHEGFYAGDGWYSDGGTPPVGLRHFDYYSSWALQVYPLWFHRIAGTEAPSSYRERLRRYLEDAQHFVAPSGAPVLQGRSLTYRYAMLGPFWTGALFDATPLPPGRTRRLASGVLRWFVSSGAVDDAGLQPIGWRGAFPPIRQLYTGAGSPYWSSKGFAGLLLPPSHPVWTAGEQPLVVETRDVSVPVPAAGWLLSGTTADGVVRLVNHGSDHVYGPRVADDVAFYARHGYATHAAPSLSREGVAHPGESHIALLDEGGRPSHRSPLRRFSVAANGVGDVLASRARAHWRETSPSPTVGDADAFRTGPWLTTASAVRGALEVRLARLDPVDLADDPDGVWEADPGPWVLRFGGWSIASDDAAPTASAAAAQVVADEGLTSLVIGVGDVSATGVEPSAGAHPLGHWSAWPWAATPGPASYGRLYAAVIVLSADPAAVADAPSVAVAADGDEATITWPDGGSTTLTLPAPQPDETLTLGTW